MLASATWLAFGCAVEATCCEPLCARSGSDSPACRGSFGAPGDDEPCGRPQPRLGQSRGGSSGARETNAGLEKKKNFMWLFAFVGLGAAAIPHEAPGRKRRTARRLRLFPTCSG